MDKILATLFVIGFLLLVAAIFALPVMWLWNLCLVPAMPTILAKIGFWQALGIKVLIGLLSYTTSTKKEQ